MIHVDLKKVAVYLVDNNDYTSLLDTLLKETMTIQSSCMNKGQAQTPTTQKLRYAKNIRNAASPFAASAFAE
jgi:hypothetical protein